MNAMRFISGLPPLFANYDENAGKDSHDPKHDSRDRHDTGGGEPVKDQKNRQEKHADVFSEVHGTSIRDGKPTDNLKPGRGLCKQPPEAEERACLFPGSSVNPVVDDAPTDRLFDQDEAFSRRRFSKETGFENDALVISVRDANQFVNQSRADELA